MPAIDMEATGRNIQLMGAAAGVSAKDIQDACGLTTRNAVYKWMKGASLPSIDNLVIIAYLFNTTIDKIIVVRV